jgi:hypothetical protein
MHDSMTASEDTMRPKKHETTAEGDLFRSRLDQIINLEHELVQLAGRIDWQWIDDEIAPLYSDTGRPGIEIRFVIGLLLLKHIYGLSDEGVCERWVHDPYFHVWMPPLMQEVYERVPAMIRCGHVLGLEGRPYTRRGPVWRCADQVQINTASAKLVEVHCFSWSRPSRSVVEI